MFGQRVGTITDVVELLNFVQNRFRMHGNTAFLGLRRPDGEKLAGKVQKKIGQVEKVIEKP
jgi:hypothetical protein